MLTRVHMVSDDEGTSHWLVVRRRVSSTVSKQLLHKILLVPAFTGLRLHRYSSF
jgi:hypothetical protein